MGASGTLPSLIAVEALEFILGYEVLSGIFLGGGFLTWLITDSDETKKEKLKN